MVRSDSGADMAEYGVKPKITLAQEEGRHISRAIKGVASAAAAAALMAGSALAAMPLHYYDFNGDTAVARDGNGCA